MIPACPLILSKPGASEARVTCLLFVVALLVPLALAVFRIGRNDQILMQTEFRWPATRPAVPLDIAQATAFPAKWDAYWRDAFPFREMLIRFQNHLRYRTLKANGIKSVFLDDGVVYGMSLIDCYRGKIRLKDSEVEALFEILRRKIEFFKKAGIAYYFVLSPSQLEFYRDAAPAAFRLPRRHVLSVQLETRVPPDVRPRFITLDAVLHEAQAREPHRRLYYKRDHHWTEWGRVLGAAGIVSALRADYPDLPPLDPAAVPFEKRSEGSGWCWYLRDLGLAFDAFPVPLVDRATEEWDRIYQKLADTRGRSPLRMVYGSDSFMEILSKQSPEILSFDTVRRLGRWASWMEVLNSPEGCRQVVAEDRPDIVLEGIYIDTLLTQHYLEENARWLANPD